MIYYIGYYNCDETRNEDRVVSPAAESKMSYLISALSCVTDETIEVVSPAETGAQKFVKGKKHRLKKNVVLKTFSSFSSKNKLIRGLGHIFTRLAVYFYLMKNVCADDHIVVYHSLLLMSLVKFIKKVKKCKLTLEVEELYSDVKADELMRKKEIDYMQTADSYIFITKLLNDEINSDKPYIISSGTFESIPDYNFRFDDSKIHVVYAGTFDRTKGGAFVAVSVAQHLSEEFTLEILGSGSKSDVDALKKKIEEVSEKTKCTINYVGLKTGDDFNSYIQACDIGLSTQQPDAKFNATSFPSKILMYMSNGLRVVSVKIPAVETSVVGDYITYYDSQDAEKIAQAVMSVDFDDDYDSRLILDKLHTSFVEQLKTLLFG